MNHRQAIAVALTLPHFFVTFNEDITCEFWHGSNDGYMFGLEITYWPEDGVWTAWNTELGASALDPDGPVFTTPEALHDHLVSVAKAHVPTFFYPDAGDPRYVAK